MLDADCERISGVYNDTTEHVWPARPMRGPNQKGQASLAQLLAMVSPNSRPQDFLAVERVEISVSGMEAKLFGPRNDVLSLGSWQCSRDGALVTSAKRDAGGEGAFDARVEIRFELRQAVDRSLIVHSFEQFSDLSVKTLLRETWFRFLPTDTQPQPASAR